MYIYTLEWGHLTQKTLVNLLYVFYRNGIMIPFLFFKFGLLYLYKCIYGELVGYIYFQNIYYVKNNFM